jgi:hypothetical protein
MTILVLYICRLILSSTKQLSRLKLIIASYKRDRVAILQKLIDLLNQVKPPKINLFQHKNLQKIILFSALGWGHPPKIMHYMFET